jgi:hypothetical protein
MIDVQRASNRTLLLLGSLVAVLGLWLWSRTQSGQVTIVDALESVLGGPRGIRNKNPGNIDWIADPARRWRGMIRKETPEEGGRFAVFDTVANGVRAIGQQLLKYERSGRNTVHALISTWAPSSENNTAAYARAVASSLQVESNDAIDVASYLPRLVAAIIKHENGVQPYSIDEISAWVNS